MMTSAPADAACLACSSVCTWQTIRQPAALMRAVYGDAFNAAMASWLITLTRAWLVHLQQLGEVLNDGGDPVEHWELAS